MSDGEDDEPRCYLFAYLSRMIHLCGAVLFDEKSDDALGISTIGRPLW